MSSYEKTTKKTSKNSSKPPSQTEKDESSLSHNGTNGKGKTESNVVAKNTRTLETVTTVRVTECDVCGADLSNSPCAHVERRTKIDIIFEKYESCVLLFAKKSDVSFTNNRAERDLRTAKVKQKVSGCFRSEIYAKAYCRISSYLQIMSSKGHNPLIAIQMALAGKVD